MAVAITVISSVLFSDNALSISDSLAMTSAHVSGTSAIALFILDESNALILSKAIFNFSRAALQFTIIAKRAVALALVLVGVVIMEDIVALVI